MTNADYLMFFFSTFFPATTAPTTAGTTSTTAAPAPTVTRRKAYTMTSVDGFGVAFEFREMSDDKLILNCAFSISGAAVSLFDVPNKPEIHLIQGRSSCAGLPRDGEVRGQLLAKIEDKGDLEISNLDICNVEWRYLTEYCLEYGPGL